jgi:hypothetical protein
MAWDDDRFRGQLRGSRDGALPWPLTAGSARAAAGCPQAGRSQGQSVLDLTRLPIQDALEPKNPYTSTALGPTTF